MKTLWKLITRPFCKTWQNITVIFAYAKFLWNNHYEWDYDYLLQLIKFKLKRMEKYFHSHNCAIVDHKVVTQEMREAINLLNLISEDDFARDKYDAYIKKYRTSNFTHRLSEEERIAVIKLVDAEEKETQEAYDTLFTQLAKRIRTWWE